MGDENNFRFWPNPSTGDAVEVEFAQPVNAMFRLFDLAGKQIITMAAQTTSTNRFVITGIPGPGVWLLEVSDGKHKVVVRVVRY